MITIIVPIYNVEKYLRRALDSIMAQTYRDWEVILVDDGSTDDSNKLAREYANKDARFCLFTQENKGVSAARNLALGKAEGEWIMFLDGDDFLHPEAMELCFNTAEHDKSDLIAFTYNRKYRAKSLVKASLHLKSPSTKFPRWDNPESYVTNNIFHFATEHSHKVPTIGVDPKLVVKHCQVWRCMYRSSLIRDIHFAEGIAYEDFPWWSEVMLRMPRTSILNLPLYYYTPNLKSTILSSDREYKIHSLETAISLAKKLYNDAPSEVKRLWESNFLIPFEDKLRKKRN